MHVDPLEWRRLVLKVTRRFRVMLSILQPEHPMRILYIGLVMLLAPDCGSFDSRDGEARNDQVLSTSTAEIKNPFQGTIRAKQWLQSSIDSADITYSIRGDQIRREVKSTRVIDKLTGSTCADDSSSHLRPFFRDYSHPDRPAATVAKPQSFPGSFPFAER